jgi:hypothetical protein
LSLNSYMATMSSAFRERLFGVSRAVSRCEMEFAKRVNSGTRECAKLGQFRAVGKEEEDDDDVVAWTGRGRECVPQCNKHRNKKGARMTLRHDTPIHVRIHRVPALQPRVRTASAIRASASTIEERHKMQLHVASEVGY